MRNTFRWLGLVTMPLRLIIGGVLLIAAVIPAMSNWPGLSAFAKTNLILMALLSCFVFFGLLTRFVSSLIFLLALLTIFIPETFQFYNLHSSFLWIIIMASSFLIFITGGGAFSVDHLLAKSNKVYQKNWFRQVAGGDIPLPPNQLKFLTLMVAITFIVILGYESFTTKSMKHQASRHQISIKADSIKINDNSLSFTVTYSSNQNFKDTIDLVYIKLFAENNELVAMWNNLNFQVIETYQIDNRNKAKVIAGEHSLRVPAGTECQLTFYSPYIQHFGAGPFILSLEDVTGQQWNFNIVRKLYQ